MHIGTVRDIMAHMRDLSEGLQAANNVSLPTLTFMSNSFNELGLSEIILQAVSDMGFSVPTPVQHESIPLALARQDVIAAAQTGTGKTAAFTLPLMDILYERKNSRKGPSSPKDANKRKAKGPRALIVTPTRELAQQIDGVARFVGKRTELKVLERV